jgi:hypothetical protein
MSSLIYAVPTIKNSIIKIKKECHIVYIVARDQTCAVYGVPIRNIT